MASEWIDASKSQPPSAFTVLVFNGNSLRMEPGWYDSRRKTWHANNSGRLYYVTHWMPMPEPPKVTV